MRLLYELGNYSKGQEWSAQESFNIKVTAGKIKKLGHDIPKYIIYTYMHYIHKIIVHLIVPSHLSIGVGGLELHCIAIADNVLCETRIIFSSSSKASMALFRQKMRFIYDNEGIINGFFVIIFFRGGAEEASSTLININYNYNNVVNLPSLANTPLATFPNITLNSFPFLDVALLDAISCNEIYLVNLDSHSIEHLKHKKNTIVPVNPLKVISARYRRRR